MARPPLEVADVFRAHGAAWRKANAGRVSLDQLKVMSAIETCRTAALGGHVERCEDCAHERIAYNSCLMGKICNGESAIDRASDMTVFRMVRWRFPCALLPIRSASNANVLSRYCRLGSIANDRSDVRKVSLWLGHANLATTEIYIRGDPTDKLEAIEAIVPPHLRKAPFDRLTDSSPCSEAARNGDHKAL